MLQYEVTVTFTDGESVTINNTSNLGEIMGIVLAQLSKTLDDIESVRVQRVS